METKDYRIHTSFIEETIKEKERHKRFLRSDLVREGKRKERLVTDIPNQYEIQYLLGPNLSIIVKRLLPVDDIERLYTINIERISQVDYYYQLIRAGAGFDIQDGMILSQHFKDDLTLLYNADDVDMVVKFHFFYDHSATVSYSRNINLNRVAFKHANKPARIGNYNPTYIFSMLTEMLKKEKQSRSYYRWRKGLGFGFNKQTI